MKNVIIGAVVAAIIVFVFQAMSWMVLPIHENTLKYSAEQDAILAGITGNLPDDGVYASRTFHPAAPRNNMKRLSRA